MARVNRVDVGGMIYHVWNRANFRSALFKKSAHYRDFLALMEESLRVSPMRILAFCLMPDHWHLVLYPKRDGDLSHFVRRITLTHTQRCHVEEQTVGYGHIYHGRYKSLPVEPSSHFLALVRYVERNAKRAALVRRADDWPWSSAHVRLYGTEEQKRMLSPWPVPEPRDYRKWLNHSQDREEVENLRDAIKRSRPYGSEKWMSRTVRQFGLENTTRARGRPKKGS